MNDSLIKIVLIIILVIIAIVLICSVSKNIDNDNSCKTDTDCSDGVCHDGECVECAFDSDCKGENKLCIQGNCIDDPNPPVPPPPVVPDDPPEIISDLQEGASGLFLALPEEVPTFPLPLEPAPVVAGTNPIDWNSFRIKNIESYSDVPGAIPGTFSTLPFNTNVSPNIAGPGVRTALNRVELTGAGAHAGATFIFTFNVSPTGDHQTTLEAVPAIFPGGPNAQFNVVFCLEICVFDTEGLQSNAGFLYVGYRSTL